MASTTPPPLQGPTAKEKKYDRQLRLWAASGQAALEQAHLLLINSGPGVIGVETLKNLVLPGIGQFTILDSAVVQEADLGVNFFLEEESLGKSRAEETTKYLQELNPDVEGHFIQEDVETFISNPDSLKPYTLIVVASPASPNLLSILSSHASETSIPLFYLHSVGFYVHFSVHLPHAFPIVDTHPDPATISDLRLLKPWPSLIEYASKKTHDLLNLSDHEHGHVPYLLLLLYYLDEWQKSHDRKLPSTYKEKTEFRKLVEDGMRKDNPEGGEENFEQAVGAVLKNLNEPVPNSYVREIFSAPETTNLTAESANFWVIASAISKFYEANKVLPLPGTVPDMKAQSNDYIELQNVYKSKARQDAEEVVQIVRATESQLGRSKKIDEKEIEAFCKGAAHIKLIRGKPFQVPTAKGSIEWGSGAQNLVFSLTDETSQILLYIAFIAYDIFYSTHANAPGSAPETVDADAEELASTARAIVKSLLERAEQTLEEEDSESVEKLLSGYTAELARCGGSELHNISSLAGGLVAQEIIKVITKQYIPVDNVCLFDGIKSTSSVLRI